MATSRDNLFQKLSGSFWNAGVTFERTNPVPLEKYSVFRTYDEASAYALTNVVAFPGQPIAVIGEISTDLYFIDTDGTLAPIATGGDADELARKLAELSSSLLSAGGTVNQLSDAISANYDAISALSNVTIPTLENTLSSGLSVTVEKLETPIEDDAATYVVRQGGLSVGDYISIPKDKVFESAYMVGVTGEPVSATAATLSAFTIKYDNITAHVLSDDTGTKSDEPELTSFIEGTFQAVKNAYFGKEGGDGPYLRITVSNQDVPIYIAMPKLVDTYYGATTDTVKVEIGSTSHQISASVLPGSIGTAHLSADAVTNDKLADDAVQTENIKDSAVTTGKIADYNVTTAKIAQNAITSDKISADAVTNTKIKDGAVTAGKIDTGAVTTDKIADENVTAVKIAQNAITSDKISADAVTNTKIKDGAVTAGKINSGAVTADKIDTGAVTTGKIADSNVTLAKLSSDVTNYIDQAETDAIAAAKTYTDEQITSLSSELKGDIQTARTDLSSYARDTSAAALAQAKTYTDEQIAALSVADVYETKTDAAAKLLSAKNYTDEKIGALDYGPLTVGADKTLSYVRQDDGKVSAEAVSIQITESQVTDLTGHLDTINTNLTGDGTGSVNARISAAKTEAVQAAKDYTDGISAALSTDYVAKIAAEKTRAEGAEAAITSRLEGLSGEVKAISTAHETRIESLELSVSLLSSAVHFRGAMLCSDIPPSALTSTLSVEIGLTEMFKPCEKGDMALYVTDGTEYIYNSTFSAEPSAWVKIGDEGTYVRKSEYAVDKAALQTADAYISSAVDSKIKVGYGTYNSGSDATYYLSNETSLSVVKIADVDYYKLIATGKQDNRVMYVVSSDYVNGYDQRIINVGTPSVDTDAVNLSTLRLSVDNIQTSIEAEKILSVKINNTTFKLGLANHLASISVDCINGGNAEAEIISLSTEITSVIQGAYGGKEPPAPGEVAYNQGEVSIKGTNLKLSPGDYVRFEATYRGQPVDTDITDDITTNTDTELKTPRGFSNSSDITDAEWASLNALLVIRKKGVRYTFPVRFADVQTDWGY